MEIASFVKSLADRYRYGIDCIIDNNDLLALALSKMPNECIEPMESCNDATNTNTVFTITCEGGNITLDSQTVITSHVFNQINVFGKGVVNVNNAELKTNKLFAASVKGVGLISNVKLIKNLGKDTVIDINGNSYDYVTIGNYDWLTSNLKVTLLNDGTSIKQNITPSVDPYTSTEYMILWEWYNSEQFLYSWYDNDINNKSRGAIYNRYAAMSSKICPIGWRVPTYEQLYNMITANNDRIRSTQNWTVPPSVPNPNGFNLIPNGYKVAPIQNTSVLSKYNAKYFDQNNVASLWTSTEVIQLDNSSIIITRPNIDYPTAIPGNLTSSFLDTTRGAYGTNGITWTPFYYSTGNCIRCMRDKK